MRAVYERRQEFTRTRRVGVRTFSLITVHSCGRQTLEATGSKMRDDVSTPQEQYIKSESHFMADRDGLMALRATSFREATDAILVFRGHTLSSHRRRRAAIQDDVCTALKALPRGEEGEREQKEPSGVSR